MAGGWSLIFGCMQGSSNEFGCANFPSQAGGILLKLCYASLGPGFHPVASLSAGDGPAAPLHDLVPSEGGESNLVYGASCSITQDWSGWRRYRKRSCRRFTPPCQNSISDGLTI